ncbi:RNA polymerase sigma factor [Ramlibacter pallidus]|uniref:Sigma-70 family RNA polymerase sigma factor n=1 Tax=Ramlibacter pallidus TaxID=2780087 RepID=A0ABR9RXK4_9BURK|nr:sigma-70 family RNA polymerase sigma factor [Ramlibacter pallidus]MBE7365980.1 sigma-70 family RNA polymerase sigma factor [Ramlibacter pallidus]
MTSNLSDDVLIALIDGVAARIADPGRQRQSEQALRALYDQTSSRLYGLAVKVVGNREWAEDVLQEAFVHVWRSAGDYRATLSPPLAWMGMIVRSRALDFLRRRTSERADAHHELDEMVSETVAGDSPDPVDTTQASQQATALYDCLSRLEARQREVVSLAYLRDLSHSELAEQLKLPLGTVKTWIRRGLDQLRGCMARYA